MTILDPAVRPPLQDADIGALRRAIARVRDPGEHADPGPADADEPVSVTVGVSGGAPSERYLFMVRLQGTGRAEFRFLDEVGDRRERAQEFHVPPHQTARIFGLLEPLVAPRPRSLYTPDSLVGFVTLRAGRLETQTTFPVHETPPGDAGEAMVELRTADDVMHVEADEMAGELPSLLAELFAEMSSLVQRQAQPA